MLEILTKSGAVVYIDEGNPNHTTMLPVALAAFGGAVVEIEIEEQRS